MREKIKYILIFLSYFIYSSSVIYIKDMLGLKLGNLNHFSQGLYFFLTDFIFLILLFLVTRKDLKDDFKNFNIELFFKFLPIYVVGLFLMGISNKIIISYTGSIPINEQGIRSLIKVFPIYMAYSSVIDAPFVEEIIFRKCFRKIFNTDILFILFSGITFGLIHVVSSGSESLIEILMGIPYIIMGLDFAYIYYKSKNIFTTMSIHAMHNCILLIMQLIGG